MISIRSNTERTVSPLLIAIAVLVAISVLVPLVVVVIVAFNGTNSLAVPPAQPSFRWFIEFLTRPAWTNAAMVSLQVSTIVALVSIIVGTPIALALVRGGTWFKRIATFLVIGPIVVPGIAYAVGSFLAWSAFGLTETREGLILASIPLAIPFVVINVAAAAVNIDPGLEFAARSLGAGPLRTTTRITLPLLLPGIAAGGLLAFVSAWDELMIAIFLQGPRVRTLPVLMWNHMAEGITPVVPAGATILLGITVVLVLLTALFRRLFRMRSK